MDSNTNDPGSRFLLVAFCIPAGGHFNHAYFITVKRQGVILGLNLITDDHHWKRAMIIFILKHNELL